MRSLKYRAWIRDYEKMAKVHSILFAGKELIIECYDDNDSDFWIRENNEAVVLMQYTGVNDKNGVEICEGDIVRALVNFGPAGDYWRTFPVKYVDQYGRYNWQEWIFNSKETLPEVIGNMYENPELLKRV